jgi:hypothetical protein
MMERDDFGNIFWTQAAARRRRPGAGGRAGRPARGAAGPKWASLLDEALQPHFATVSAQLWLKVNEPQKAFPFIEQLAKVNPRKGKDLANEFLRVWIAQRQPQRRQPRRTRTCSCTASTSAATASR